MVNNDDVYETEEVLILRNGKEMARLISHDKSISFLTDSLAGILKHDYDEEAMRTERMAKYEGAY